MMTSKLLAVRISKEAYDNFKKKQTKMNSFLSSVGVNKRKIPLTRVITMASKQTIFPSDNELMKAARRARK